MPALNSMLTRITMMRTEIEQVTTTLINQHSQCIQAGSPINFINSCEKTTIYYFIKMKKQSN